MLDEMNISAICEVMNQMMGASATALSELLSMPVNISTPKPHEVESVEQFKEDFFEDESEMVVIHFDLKIEDKMQSEFLNVMPVKLAKKLVSGFLSEMGASPDEEAAAPQAPEVPQVPAASQAAEQPAPAAAPTPESSAQAMPEAPSSEAAAPETAAPAAPAPAPPTRGPTGAGTAAPPW